MSEAIRRNPGMGSRSAAGEAYRWRGPVGLPVQRLARLGLRRLLGMLGSPLLLERAAWFLGLTRWS